MTLKKGEKSSNKYIMHPLEDIWARVVEVQSSPTVLWFRLKSGPMVLVRFRSWSGVQPFGLVHSSASILKWFSVWTVQTILNHILFD